MIGEVGDIDQGFYLLQHQVVNLDDHPNFIKKTWPFKSPKHQTPIFVDSNDHVTLYYISNQTFDIVSFMIKACNLPGTWGKPNKKATTKKWHLFKEFPSTVEVIKKHSQIAKELKLLTKRCKWQRKLRPTF